MGLDSHVSVLNIELHIHNDLNLETLLQIS